LESKHYLKRGFNQSRSLEIAPRYYDEQRQHRQAPPPLEIPLLGRIAAGVPVESLAGNDTVSFADFTADPGTYALQVRGESMVEDHICDGDFVLVGRAATHATARSLWLWLTAWKLRSSASTKRPATASVLQPANATMKPIYVAASSVAIQGKCSRCFEEY